MRAACASAHELTEHIRAVARTVSLLAASSREQRSQARGLCHCPESHPLAPNRPISPISMFLEVNQIHVGDCLQFLPQIKPASIDLVYLDPPFNTGRAQQLAGHSYDDAWPSLHDYLAFMRKRLEPIVATLKHNGSLLLHCDWRTCHHFRLMLDELFTPDGFVNHLIWSYGLGGSSPRRFARKHDDILFYAKGPDYYFDPPRVPATSVRMRGQLKKATDVLDIPSINNMSHERAGFPTQKPLELLRLLVNACCPPGGVVLDPFCGSGTTLVAAAELGRSFIGIDRDERAVAIARARCEAVSVAQARAPVAQASRL